uniref:Uncharacterized protein n=1 Tax=Leptobrachium leishanense TaxID=445787 RepID=A0A8C5WF86_9ANUR
MHSSFSSLNKLLLLRSSQIPIWIHNDIPGYLNAQGIGTVGIQTERSIKEYNISARVKVGGIFHSTYTNAGVDLCSVSKTWLK